MLHEGVCGCYFEIYYFYRLKKMHFFTGFCKNAVQLNAEAHEMMNGELKDLSLRDSLVEKGVLYVHFPHTDPKCSSHSFHLYSNSSYINFHVI